MFTIAPPIGGPVGPDPVPLALLVRDAAGYGTTVTGQVTYGTDHRPATHKGTVSFWVKAENKAVASMRVFTVDQGTIPAADGCTLWLNATASGYILRVVFDDGASGLEDWEMDATIAIDMTYWRHILVRWDMGLSAGSRVEIYIDGELIDPATGSNWNTSTSTGTAEVTFGGAYTHHFAPRTATGVHTIEGMISSFAMLVGQWLEPEAFGKLVNSEWLYKIPVLAFDTPNDIYLPLSDSVNGFGANDNPDGLDLAESGSMPGGGYFTADTPSFDCAVFSDYWPVSTPITGVFRGGHSVAVASSSSRAAQSFAVDAGQWWWQMYHYDPASTARSVSIGIVNDAGTKYYELKTDGTTLENDGGGEVNNAASLGFTLEDEVSLELDFDNLKLRAWVNGATAYEFDIPSGETWSPSFTNHEASATAYGLVRTPEGPAHSVTGGHVALTRENAIREGITP